MPVVFVGNSHDETIEPPFDIHCITSSFHSFRKCCYFMAGKLTLPWRLNRATRRRSSVSDKISSPAGVK